MPWLKLNFDEEPIFGDGTEDSWGALDDFVDRQITGKAPVLYGGSSRRLDPNLENHRRNWRCYQIEVRFPELEELEYECGELNDL